MKDKILEIFKRELSIYQSGYMNGNADLEGKEDAAEAITQEICNAQANGWWDGNEQYREKTLLLDYLIQEGYTVKQAETAIEQLKNKEG